LFLDSLDQTFFEFGIVHWQNGLLSVQINLGMRAFAGLEDCSLLREPTPELLARHFSIVNNIVYIDNGRDAKKPVELRSTGQPRAAVPP
jgi:hypothetical protein